MSTQTNNMPMSRSEREQQLCSCLLEEARASHERIGAFTDSTKKFINLMLTLTTLAAGYLFSQVKDNDWDKLLKEVALPYELLFLSAFISLALAQTTHYNSLAFFYMERKRFVGRRLQQTIGLLGNPMDGQASLRKSSFWTTFKVSSYAYYIIEATIGILFAAAAWVARYHQNGAEASFTFFWFVGVLASIFALLTGVTTVAFLLKADGTTSDTLYLDASKRKKDPTLALLDLLPPLSVNDVIIDDSIRKE